MDNILYFPKMGVPNKEWAIQNILYWEEVQCIIPASFIYEPETLPILTRNLLREGVIKQVHPEHYIYGINGFTETFINYIDCNLSQRLSFIENQKANSKNNRPFWRYDKIHMGKMANIGDELVERGLAIMYKDWYIVEKSVSKAFMTYLAFLLSKETGAIPTTDAYSGFQSLALLENPDKIVTANYMRDNLRAKILKNIMPVPEWLPNDDLVALLRFKEKNHDKLIRYRKYIEDFLIAVEIMSENDRKSSIERFTQEANVQITSIQEKLQVKFGRVFLGTFCTIATGIIPLAVAIAGNDLPSMGLAVPGVLGAVYTAYEANNIQTIRTDTLAYAALTNTRFKNYIEHN